MPIFIGTSTKNQAAISTAITQMGKVYVGDKLVWSKGTPNANSKYGFLYNRYAATDSRNIVNTGWHVPGRVEWQSLQTYVGSLNGGNRVKEIGTTYWLAGNNGINDVGFNARGAGIRSHLGIFTALKSSLYYHHSTIIDDVNSWYTRIQNNLAEFYVGTLANGSKFGMCIRLIKDSTTLTHGQTGTYTGNNGKIYQTICIGTQEWLSENLIETKYRNGDWIAGFDGGVYTSITNANWAAKTTGAMCAYNDDLNNV
jgi:uncharacterized protein (TIGR02145 family)